MGQNLTGQTIASTYEDLVQISGSILTDGTGSNINSLTITASFATQALNVSTATIATTATSASQATNANNAISASYALTASFALNGGGGTVNTGSLLVTASISNATTTFTKGDGSTFALTTNNVSNASTASFVATAVLTGSVASNVLTFTKFDGSTFNLTVNTGSAGAPAGLISGSAPRSLISANYQPTASVASGTGSIAIGNNVQVDSTNQFALGTNITSSAGGNTETIAIGTNHTIQGNVTDSVLIGDGCIAQNGKTQMVYIGGRSGTTFANQQSVAIGFGAQASAASVSVGINTNAGNDSVSIGANVNQNAGGSVSIGSAASSLGNNSVTLGLNAANTAGNSAITIGTGQTTAVADEINIGGKFRFNSGSNGIIELRDDTKISGSITATLSSSVQSDAVYYNSTTGLLTYGAAGGGSTPNLQSVTSVGASTSASISLTDGANLNVTSSGNISVLGGYVQINDNTNGNLVLGPNYVSLNAVDNSIAQLVNFSDNNGFDTSGISFTPTTFELDVYTYNNARIRLGSPTQVTGSLRGQVSALTIASNTASLDCATNNFFTLQLVSGSNTFINPSNIQPGQTINLRVNTTGSATVSFPSSIKQVSGSAYVPTTTTGVDVVTFISFDSSSLLLSNIKNLV